MRERRIVITAAVHNGEIAVLVKLLEPGHTAAEAEVVVNFENLLRGDAELGTKLVIGVVAVGNQSVETVIAAGKFQHHQDLAFRSLTLRGKSRCGLREQRT